MEMESNFLQPAEHASGPVIIIGNSFEYDDGEKGYKESMKLAKTILPKARFQSYLLSFNKLQQQINGEGDEEIVIYYSPAMEMIAADSLENFEIYE